MPHTVEDDAKTLDAAMEFLAHYEVPAGLPGKGDDLHDTSCFGMNGTMQDESINLTHAFKHSHSLEIPELDRENSEAVTETALTETQGGELGFDLDFSAVQALIDEVDGESDLLGIDPSVSESTISTQPQSLQPEPASTARDPHGDDTTLSSPAPPVWMRRRGRQKRLSRKDEIAGLRSTVSELSDKLEKMRASPTSAPSSPEPDDASTQAISFISQSESLWEKVAARQLLLRQKSEAANAQLRRMMDTQVRRSKNLKRMLNRRSKIEGLEDPAAAKRHKSSSPTGQLQNHNEIFDELLRRAEGLYVGLDKLFAEKDMAEVPCPGRKRQVSRNTVNGTFVEFMDKQRVPFSVKHAQRAVWQMLKSRNRSSREAVTHFASSEPQAADSLVHTSYTSFVATAEDVSAEVQRYKVARKYAEAERIVFICEHLTEPLATSGSERSYGLKFWETLVIRISTGEPLASGGETSIIESLMRATRQDEGFETALQFRGAAYIDVAVAGWDQTISLNNQEIENLLFDQTMGSN